MLPGIAPNDINCMWHDTHQRTNKPTMHCQLWRLVCGTSRSERLSVSEFRSVSYCCRGGLLHASF